MDFDFVVRGPSGIPAEEQEGDSTNVFDRLNLQEINLDGRYGPAIVGPGADVYTLDIALSKAQLEVGQATQVTIIARANGLPLIGQVVSILSSDTSVGEVPTSVITGSGGAAVFEVIAGALGATLITASMVVSGTTYPSNGVTLAVVTLDAPENYDATGYGQVILSVDGPLAVAMMPRIQRLSHQEQIRRHPSDTGLMRLTSYENLEITFLPPFLQ